MVVKRPCSPWVPYYDPEKCSNGYTLFTPLNGAVAWLIDMEGHPVHCWNMPYNPGGYGKLLPNGNLLYAGMDIDGPIAWAGAAGGYLLEIDWDGAIVWQHHDPYQHHDFCRMDSGNTMYLGMVQVPEELVPRIQGGRPGTERDGVMWTDYFREVTPEGDTVWEWYAYEHLDFEIDTIAPLIGRAEWTHGNACFVMPDGDILTTFHHLDSAAIIDKKTGNIKWRWGKGEMSQPHDPTRLDNGNILIFDNGPQRSPGATPGGAGEPQRPGGPMIGTYSRVVEVNPQTNTVEWQYMADPPPSFYSPNISGAQRLPNGNTLICEGAPGRIFEVTPEKEVVWEYLSPFYARRHGTRWERAVFRAYRYPAEHAALEGRTLDPDQLEFTLREKPFGKERAMKERLQRLGY